MDTVNCSSQFSVCQASFYAKRCRQVLKDSLNPSLTRVIETPTRSRPKHAIYPQIKILFQSIFSNARHDFNQDVV